MGKEHLADRIYGEYQAYKAEILGLPNEEIFGKSYEINTMVNLYEILMEKIQGLPESVLEVLLRHRNILWELYDSWLAKDDSSYEELSEHVQEEIGSITDRESGNGKAAKI